MSLRRINVLWLMAVAFAIAFTAGVMQQTALTAFAADDGDSDGGALAAAEVKLADAQETLATQSDTIAPWEEGGSYEADLVLDEAIAVSTDENGLYYRFVPTESGSYFIYSSNNNGDPCAYLYAADGEQLYYSDDDEVAGNRNFGITCDLEAGTTYYVLARGLNDEVSFDLTVELYDPNKLAFASVSYTPGSVRDGVATMPTWTLWMDDEELEEGVDFTTAYYTDEARTTPATLPLAIGSYYAAFTPTEGSAYSGTKNYEVEIYDAYDLSHANYWVDKRSYAYTGSPVAVDVSAEAVDGVELVQGTDYEIAFKETNWGDLSEPPTEVGEYSVGIKEVDGGKYTGESSSFTHINIVEANDLSLGEFSLARNNYAVKTGHQVQVEVEYARAADGTVLVQGQDFELVFYDEGGDEELASAPSEPGEYYVSFKGIGSYTGYSNSRFQITIYDPYNLAENDVETWVDYEDRLYVGATSDDFTVSVECYGENGGWAYLTEGTDFEVTGYQLSVDDEWVDVDDFSVGGQYRAVIEGIDPYYGTVYATFTVYDPNDLSGAYVWATNDLVVLGDATITPVWKVELNDRYLAEGTDYTVAYYLEDEDGNLGAQVEAPLGVGSYAAVFSPAEGSAYSGTCTEWFQVADDSDLASGYFRLATSEYAATGEAVQLKVRYAESASGANLELGTDYVLAYRDSDENGLASAPSEPGGYYVTMTAAEGSSYKGTCNNWRWFRIIDQHDLTYAQFGFVNNTLVYSGSPVQFELEYAKAYDGTALELGKDFEFFYVVWDDDEGEYVEHAGLPTEIGSYEVGIRALDGNANGYFGKTDEDEYRFLNVVASNDLNYGKCSLNTWSYQYTGNPVELDVEYVKAPDGTVLEQGKDYELVFYDSEEEPASAPSDPGEYYVGFKGIGDYTGECRTWFSIYDPYDFAADDDDDGHFWFSATSFFAGEMPANFGAYAYSYEFKTGLVEGTDYISELQVKNEDGEWVDVADGSFDGTTAGYYRFVLTGKDPYHGTGYAYFDVRDPKDLSNAESSYSDAIVRGDGTTTPTWEVTLNSVVLQQGADYVVTYYAGYLDDDEEGTPVEAPLGAGRYTAVFSSADGSPYTGTYRDWLRIVDATDLDDADFSLTPSSYAVTGSPIVPTIQYVEAADGVALTEGVDYELSYYKREYDDEDYYYYTPLASAPSEVGVYYVSLKAVAGGAYTSESYKTRFAIVDPNDLGNASISLSTTTYAYTGQPVALELAYVKAFDGTALIQGTDYELVFYDCNSDDEEVLPDGAPSAIGSYAVVAKAVEGGTYTGESYSRWFEIVAPNDLALASVSKGSSAFAYTGQAIDLALTVTMGEKTLVAGTDYDVEYYNESIESGWSSSVPIEIGYYNVRITGKGDFEGECYTWFRIAAVNSLSVATLSGVQSSYAYTGQAIAPKPTVTDASGNVLVEGTHYTCAYFVERYYIEDGYEDWYWGVVDASKCVEAGYYAVRVAAISGGGYEGEQWMYYTIEEGEIAQPADISTATVTVADQVYSGAALTPAVTVMLDGAVVPASGYTVAYANNVNAGTASVTVTGAGDFTGSASGTFTIAPRGVTVAANDAFKAYGADEPELTARVSGLIGSDTVSYTVARAAGEDAGSYAITVSGAASQGNYSVTFVGGTFTIAPKVVTVTAVDASKTYGDADPALTATVSGLVGSDTVAYTVTRVAGEDVRAGGYDIQVVGESLQGNYSVMFVNGTFTINPQAVTITVVGKSASAAYDGSEYAVAGYDVVVPDGSGLSADDVQFSGTAEAKGTETGTYNMGLAASMFGLVSSKAGNYNATFSVTDGSLTIYDASTTIVIDAPAAATGLVYNGAAQTGVAAGDGAHYTVTDGFATNAGTYTATVTADDGYVFADGQSVAVVWSIAPKAATVTAADAAKAYGAADPELTVTVSGLIGSDSVAYTVARAAGEDAGIYAITASGASEQGNYSVTYVSGTFAILAQSIADATVVGLADATYTGSAITQSPMLSVGGKVLSADTDYQVAYANNVNAGTATVVFTGKGNYSGTVISTFTINKKAGAITVKAKKATFTSKAKKKATFAAKKVFTVSTNISGGKVTYTKKSGNKKITIAKNGKVTIKKGLKKGTYKVKVVATSAATTNYNAATSKVLTLKFKLK